MTPHQRTSLDNLAAEPDCPDNAARPAALAVHMAARYQAEQGLHLQAEALHRTVLAAG